MSLYSRMLGDVLIPAYDAARGRKHSAYRKFAEQSQWWNEEQIRAYQWEALTKLLQHAYRNVPATSEAFRSIGARPEDIRTPQDFARLPILTREDINTRRDELRATNFPERLIEHATGGSSGVPTRFLITYESYEWRCAVSERAYSWSGCRLGDRTLYLWGAPIGTLTRSAQRKMKIFRSLRRELMFNTFSQNEELWETIYRQARAWKPKLVVGYVSSLEQFCRYLIASGKSLPGVTAAIAAAEPVYDTTRELVDKALSAPLFNTYGSREFMSIGAECEHHDGLHTHAENLYLETETNSTTEASPLLVTDLHNHGMPFIRYRIGDLAILDNTPCRCGRGLPRIRSIQGRILDAMRTTDGRHVPGEFFPHLMKDIPEIREFQARQESTEKIVLLVVQKTEMSEGSQRLLDHEIQKVFGSSTRIEVQRVDEIPRLASGKRRVTVGLPQ
jgi:phenylacetate-coenzyme A ligase PaaK-like adenylate-forming protein